jgi:hypothetical protein
MSSIWHCFNITTHHLTPLSHLLSPKQALPLGPMLAMSMSFNDPTYTFSMSSYGPTNFHPSSTHANHRLNLTSSIVVDYNTINDIYSMICILQNKMCSGKNGTRKSCLRFLFFKMQKDKLHNASHEQQLLQFEPKNDI